jgi:2'-5' RNA ligase
MRHQINLTARGLWHLTLAFLGEVAPERVTRAQAAVEAAASNGWPISGLQLAGGGTFGRGRFTVLWVGLQGDLRPLRTLAVRELRQAKLPYDAQRFHSHLTLARPGNRVTPETLAADRAALDQYEGPQWSARELVLVRSFPGPHPRHEALAKASLAGTAPA